MQGWILSQGNLQSKAVRWSVGGPRPSRMFLTAGQARRAGRSRFYCGEGPESWIRGLGGGSLLLQAASSPWTHPLTQLARLPLLGSWQPLFLAREAHLSFSKRLPADSFWPAMLTRGVSGSGSPLSPADLDRFPCRGTCVPETSLGTGPPRSWSFVSWLQKRNTPAPLLLCAPTIWAYSVIFGQARPARTLNSHSSPSQAALGHTI